MLDYWQQKEQRWKFVKAGKGYYYIVNAVSDEVMDIRDYSKIDGAANVLWTKEKSNNQKFQLIDCENGYYKIKNKNSGLILDIKSTDGQDESIQNTDSGVDSQLWSLKAINSTSLGDRRNSFKIVSDMGVGWNLGNALDSNGSWIENETTVEYETAWGNPVTTKAMIDAIRSAGFKTVRIPVSWSEHMGSAPDYIVDSEWIDRVEEVVNYVLDNDMYAIIDVHHDGYIPSYINEESDISKLQKLWTQIAMRFKEYDNHLIFEVLNEPRLEGTEYEWTGGTEESRDVVNKYNLAALNAIRLTGGNNTERAVVIQSYAGSGEAIAIEELLVPNDENIIVDLHTYTPYDFAMNPEGTDYWGSKADENALIAEFDRYYDKFIANGIPVIIGEFGSINKDNLSSRVELTKYIMREASKREIPCIWWDNNYIKAGEEESFGLFNRTTLEWNFPEIVDVLMEGDN